MNNQQELNQKIQSIEQLITDTKATLKSWAKQIGQYHTQLKAFTSQLATLKKQIIMKENNNKTHGGTK